MKQLKRNALFAAVIAMLAVPTYAARPTPDLPATVTVINPATNPVITTEAFARIPVNRSNSDGIDYVVPDGYRLVIETASAYVECQRSNMALVRLTAGNSAALIVPLARDFGGVTHQGSVSARVWWAPASRFSPRLCATGQRSVCSSGHSSAIW